MLADFTSVDDAARATSAIIAAGIVPAALEMMDHGTIAAVEASIYAAGYPARRGRGAAHRGGRRAGGARRRRARGASASAATCGARDGAHRAATPPSARGSGRDARRRSARWAAWRRTSRCRTRSSRARSSRRSSRAIAEIGARHRVHVCNVFHAGDGNLHPNVPYDGDDPDEAARVHAAMREIMAAVHRRGRHDHRRARRGPRQDRLHGAALLPAIARRDVPPARRVRSGAARESRQGGARRTRAASGSRAPGARA